MNRVDMSHIFEHKEYTEEDIETHLFLNTQPTDKQVSGIFDNATTLTFIFVYATQARFDMMVITNIEHPNADNVIMFNTRLYRNMSLEDSMAKYAKSAVDHALHTLNKAS